MKTLIVLFCAILSCNAATAQTVKGVGSTPKPVTRTTAPEGDHESEKERPMRTAVTLLRNGASMKDKQQATKELLLADQYLHRPESALEQDYAFMILMLAAAFENVGKQQKAQSLYSEFDREVSKKGSKSPSEVIEVMMEAAVWAPIAAQNQLIGHTLAEEIYRRARQLKPPDDYQTAKALTLLGGFEQDKRNHAAALRYLYRALSTIELKSDDSQDRFTDMQKITKQLVELELERGNYDAAERLCSRMIDNDNERQPNNHDLVSSIDLLVRILDRSGKHERANSIYAEWREKLRPRFAVYISLLSSYAHYARDYGDITLANELDKEYTSLNNVLMTWSQVRNTLQAYANDLKRAGFDSLSQKATKAEKRIRAIYDQDSKPETTIATAFGIAPRPRLQTKVSDPVPEKLRQAALKQSTNVDNALQKFMKDLDSIGADGQKRELRSVQILLAEIKKEQGKTDTLPAPPVITPLKDQ